MKALVSLRIKTVKHRSPLPRCYSTNLGQTIRNLKDKEGDLIGKEITLRGWIKSVRHQKQVTFLDVSDGTTTNPLQAVMNTSDLPMSLTFGSCVELKGILKSSAGSKQAIELEVSSSNVIGECDNELYPLQPKQRPTMDFLREIAHLRPRSNFFSSTLRVRNTAAQAFNNFLQQNGFIHVHSPIITSNDCEGAGQAFLVKNQGNSKDEFFGQPAYLTVSGQLHAEMVACSMSRVYTFGPTFRAEASHTSRHLAEFWMLEPEIAFCDLNQLLQFTEDMVKFGIDYVLKNSKDDIDYFNKWVDKELLNKLGNDLSKPFQRLEYKEAIEIISKEGKGVIEKPLQFGEDLSREHEKFLSDTYFKKPVFVINWPKSIKPFYMRQNDDGETVAAMDLIVPGIGEIVGGSSREERFDRLKESMVRSGLLKEVEGKLDSNGIGYDWYLDLRKYGTVPHSGCGLGFERFIQYVTGINNIRDTIPIPRYQGNCKY